MNEEVVTGRDRILLSSARILARDVRKRIVRNTRDFAVSVARPGHRLALDLAIDLARSPIQVGEQWGGPWEYGYFLLEAEIPDDWASEQIGCRLDFGGEALVYDERGEPVVGLSAGSVYDFDGAFKKDMIVLPCDDLRRRITLRVEATGNALLGVRYDDVSYVDVPTSTTGEWKATLGYAMYGLYDSAAFQLALDVDHLLSLYGTIPPDSRRGKAIMNALFAAGNHFYDGELTAARRALDGVLEEPSQAATSSATVIGHAHLDTAWLWTMKEAERKACRTFASQVDLLDRYDDYVFGASSAQHYDWVRQNHHGLFSRIRKYVDSGRWEIQGAMWVEPDCNLVSPESLVLQIREGLHFWRKHFDVRPRTCWIPDVFGYPSTLPQILAGTGVPYLLTQKMSWSQFNTFPHHSFLWVGRDGSQVLAHFPPENTYNSWAQPRDLAKAAGNYKEKTVSDEFLVLAGFGDGGGGPTEEHVEHVQRSRGTAKMPQARFGRSEAFFDRLNSRRNELPQWTGELYLEYHRGTYTTHGMVKKNNRRVEQALRALEALSTLCSPSALPTRELRETMQRMLTLQFHDILPGSSIHQVYLDALSDYYRIRRFFDDLAATLVNRLIAKSSDDDMLRLVLFNALAQEISGGIEVSTLGLFPDFAGPETTVGAQKWPTPPIQRLDSRTVQRVRRVIDQNGRSVPFQVIVSPEGEDRLFASLSVAPLSLGTIHLQLGDVTPDRASWKEESGAEFLLVNDCAAYSFDRSGTFTHLESDERRGNALTLFHDRPHAFEAWDIDFTYPDQIAGYPEPGEVYRLAPGPVLQGLRFVLAYGASKIVQDVLLFNGSEDLHFETTVEWNERRKLLRTSFPVHPAAQFAECDLTWGTISRTTEVNTDWDFAQFEFPAHAFVNVNHGAEGIALLNNSKYGYSCRDGRLGLSLLRSTADPDPVADLGVHRFTYVYKPHRGNIDRPLVRSAAEVLNRPPAVFVPDVNNRLTSAPDVLHYQLPVQVEGIGVVAHAIRWAEDGTSIILRFGETIGEHTAATLIIAPDSGILAARMVPTDLLEQPISDAPIALPASVMLEPFQVYTVRILITEN